MQRDEVLSLFAAVGEALQVGLEKLEHSTLELRLGDITRRNDAEPQHLRGKNPLRFVTNDIHLWLPKDALQQDIPVLSVRSGVNHFCAPTNCRWSG